MALPEGTFFPLLPSHMCRPSLSEGHSTPGSRVWGSRRFPVPGMPISQLPTAVEPLTRGEEQARRMAKGSMWGKPARGKIDI